MTYDPRNQERPTGGTATMEEKLSAAIDSTQQKAVESIGPTTQRIGSFVQQQKVLGAEQIDGVARAVHSAGREFQDEMPSVAQSVHDAAAKLEDASSSLREQSAEELIGAIRRFARNQPAAFFGGAVLAGFALSRFLKSSAERRNG